MKRRRTRLTAGAISAALGLGICASLPGTAADRSLSTKDAVASLEDGIVISNENISGNNFKNTNYNNPISSEFFCADPTAVEYNGRLYVIGTNDHEQFEASGPDVDNTYEKIFSLVILSTDDMVNWVYHGEINVGEVAPWIMNSWAPTIVSRVEEDGLTHFYLYFSNNGTGVGVIHTTDLLGEWDDPLGKPLITSSTPGIGDCPNPFDPGAVIDENGVGWLAFGAGKAADGTDYMPGTNRIARLGEDMISISEVAEIPAPYHFEASELNYINGTYVYTYNNDWSDHSAQWDYDCPVPSSCSMVYMTTKTPLDPTSWEMRGEYFVNPGTAGFDYSNNHTHLHKFKGEYYLFYHTLMLKRGMGITGAYRSMNVDKIHVDEETVTIEKTAGTKNGPDAISGTNPFIENIAADLNNTADTTYDMTDRSRPSVIGDAAGSWFSVRDVEFTESTTPDEPVVLDLTKVNTIDYNITVLSVDKNTTVSMHPASSDGVNHTGAVDVTGAGEYTISCDMEGADGMMNMGYFTASDDALITFTVDSITVNGTYTIDISAELTNTREWADGLRNIWNGYSDGDKVYISEFAEFRYVKETDSICLYAAANVQDENLGNAPLLESPVTFYANVKGTGRLEVRLDDPTGDLLTSVDFDSPDDFTTIYNKEVAAVGGTRDLYFVFSGAGIAVDAWQFAPTGEVLPTEPDASEETTEPSATETEVPTPGTEALYGDVDCNAKVEIVDVIALSRSLMGAGALDGQGAVNADVDRNTNINTTDALHIMKYLVKLIDALPVS